MANIMLTDAERSSHVSVPRQFVQTSTILSQMMGSRSFIDGTQSEMVLDVPTDIFNLFVSWLFHSSDFIITKENVEALLEMAHKYQIPTMANDIGGYVVSQKLISPEYGYTLGVSFSVSVMESTYHPHVVQNFANFLLHREGPKYIGMLAKWSPQKIHPLLKETLSHLRVMEDTIKECKLVSEKLSEVTIPISNMISKQNYPKQLSSLEAAISGNYGAARALKRV